MLQRWQRKVGKEDNEEDPMDLWDETGDTGPLPVEVAWTLKA